MCEDAQSKQATAIDVLRCLLVLLELLRGADEADNAAQKRGDGVRVRRREGEVQVKGEGEGEWTSNGMCPK